MSYADSQCVGFNKTDGAGPDFWGNGWYGPRNDAVSPYTSTLLDNAPTGADIIALYKAGLQILTFTQSVANPVFASVSRNGNDYGVDQDFEILSQRAWTTI